MPSSNLPPDKDAAAGDPDGRDLRWLRDRIDAVDYEIVELLNQRARYVLEMAEVKRRLARPVYDPVRERAILKLVTGQSQGPLEAAAVQRLFERIIDESRRMERLRMETLAAGHPTEKENTP